MGTEQNSGKKVMSGFMWRLLERFGARAVEFIVALYLKNQLGPDKSASLAILLIYINIIQVLVDSGMGNSLIQKKDSDDKDFSTVFYFNVVFCILLYALLFFTAPFLLFNRPELVPHLRVLGVTILISGVKNVQSAYVSKHFLFKKFFFSTLGGTITAAVVGLWMASQGFGVWALVAQYLVNTTIDTAILWITVKWRPQKYFSFKRLGVLFSYGWKLLVSSLLNVGYGQMTKWLIGLKYTNTDLGCYDNAESFTGFLANNVNTSIDTVLFPAMAGAQDDRARVKSMTRRAMKTSIFVLAPMMAGLAACSESIIKVVLTDEWLLSIPFILILAITYTFYPLHTANLNAMKALGRSDKFLKLEIIKKSIGVVLLLLSMNYGVMAITLTYLVSDIASQIINTFPNKKLIDYGYFEQLKDILPTVLLAWAMGGIVFCVRLLGLNSLVTLLIQIPLGILIYYLGARLFKMESLDFALNALKSIIGKKEKKA